MATTNRLMPCHSSSVRLGARELDHPGPLLRLVGDEPSEVGGRTRKRCATQISEPRLDVGIGEARIDLFVELVDDVGGRILGNADAIPLGWPRSPARTRPRLAGQAAPPSASR